MDPSLHFQFNFGPVPSNPTPPIASSSTSIGLTTLRKVLTIRKYPILCTTEKVQNATNGDWRPFTNSDVELWRDFNLGNLNESYSPVLDLLFDKRDIQAPDLAILRNFTVTEDRYVGHLVDWNRRMMERTLPFGQAHLGLYVGSVIEQRASTVDSFSQQLQPPAMRGSVHHVINMNTSYPAKSLVLGIARTSKKVQGEHLLANSGKNVFWALAQLFSSCQTLGTRYGYFQTDKELIVCRFFLVDGKPKASVMPIPWTVYGEGNLTTDLALWWLAMLAMSSDENRVIKERDSMVEINHWAVDQAARVRTHSYSGRRARF